MTLVPNRLRRLNGSNIALVFLLWLALVSLSACNILNTKRSKPTPDRPSAGKEVPPLKDQTMKMDTLSWTRGDGPHADTPIKQPETTSPKKPAIIKDFYKVAVLIPLYTTMNEDAQKNENLRKMLHFMLGMEIASEHKRRGTPQIQFDFIDIESYTNRIQSILKKDSLGSYDLIVGPYKTSDLQAVSKFSSKYDIPVISPWNASSTITDNNPLYIQLKPGLKPHAETIAEHIVRNYPGSEVYLVASESHTREVSNLDLFANTKAFLSAKNRGVSPVKKVLHTKVGNMDGEIQKLLSGNQPKIFVLPYFSEWNFVSSFLNRVNALKKEGQRVIIYGLPQIIESGKIEYQLFHDLNLHISYFNHIDPNDSEVIRFASQFVDKFGDRPMEDAFLGYDLAIWISQALRGSGIDFVKNHNKHAYNQGLFNDVRITPVYGSRAPSDDFSNYIYLENSGLSIIRLVNYRFEAARD